MAKGRRKNLTNRNQDHSPSPEPSTLTCTDYSRRDLGTKTSPTDAQAMPSWARQTPLLWPERCPDVWSPKWGLPQKLCGSCLSQKLLAS